jgi:hypothetical protein
MLPRCAHGGKAARGVKELYRQNAAFSRGYGPTFSLAIKENRKLLEEVVAIRFLFAIMRPWLLLAGKKK